MENFIFLCSVTLSGIFTRNSEKMQHANPAF